MQLITSALSPFARKCLIVAKHLKIDNQLKLESTLAHPIERNASIVAKNPLGQIPTLTLEDGQVLFDSRVICEYFNTLGKGTLFGTDNIASLRWEILTDASLADGITDATILVRYEQVIREKEQQSQAWITGQLDKVHKGLAFFNEKAEQLSARFDIGTISLVCALDYLSIRLPDFNWQSHYPKLATWLKNHAEQYEEIATTQPKTP